jgi:hypothetical protein
MVSLFEAFYVFSINFCTLSSKIIPRFIHQIQFLIKLSFFFKFTFMNVTHMNQK